MKEYGTFDDFYKTFRGWKKKEVLEGAYDIARELCEQKKLLEKTNTKNVALSSIIEEIKELVETECYDYEYETYSNMDSEQVTKLAEIIERGKND